MLAGAVFVAVTWAMKELPPVYASAPWRDDPYDAVVSFSILLLPVLLGLCAIRVPLCRRDSALPVRRAIDLLRASRALVGLMAVTLAAEWASVVVGRGGAAFVGVQAVLTVACAAAAWEVRRASRARVVERGSQPDWLADALVLAPGAEGVVRRIRRRPVVAAAAVAVAFGAAVAGVQAVVEGDAWRAALLVWGVGAGGMFVFLVLAGAYLRVVGR